MWLLGFSTHSQRAAEMSLNLEELWNDTENHDKNSLHDVMYEANNVEPSEEEVKKLFLKLPRSIIGDIVSWGLSDTVVRDSIYTFIQSERD